MFRRLFLITVAFLTALATHATISSKEDTVVLNRIFSHSRIKKNRNDRKAMNVYMRHHVTVIKKNNLLITVPTMNRLARSKNTEFVGESYSRVKFKSTSDYDEVRQIDVGTIPRFRRTLPTMIGMLTPNIYGVTIMHNHLLSPFHYKNRKIYRYGLAWMPEGKVQLAFVPKTSNTQTIKGTAIVDAETGNVEHVDFEGEYDMISFRLKAVMEEPTTDMVLPMKSDLDATFHMAGNRINAVYHVAYEQPVTLPDTLVDSHSRELMEIVRPSALLHTDLQLYKTADSLQALEESLPKKIRRKNLFKTIFWDFIGDNLINRIRGNFGPNQSGYYKIYPIIDPLSLSYSGRKGIAYKVRFRGNYLFTKEQELELYCRLGYSFKQKQFYFMVPVKYSFMKSRNGYVETEIGNGNRIRNNSIKNNIIGRPDLDSTQIERMGLDQFKDTYWKIRSNYDLSSKWSIGLGFTYHRRSAVNKSVFKAVGLPTVYHSFAPRITTQIRPLAWNGPILTVNYEHALKNLSSEKMSYGRLEADASWIKRFHMLRSLSLRGGVGLYFDKEKQALFLDYENFRDENIPGGWNDDWTGEFQLLSSELYNKSDYYMRANMTYESPLMVLSRLPLLGKYVEMERIYVSSLVAKDLHPYTEFGYGFTNRLFTFGLFMAASNGRYEGFGCRVAIEIFREW